MDQENTAPETIEIYEKSRKRGAILNSSESPDAKKQAIDDVSLITEKTDRNLVPNVPVKTGQILNNRYEILKKLGSGAFGAVYMAIDTQSKQDVAIKIGKTEDSTMEKEIEFLQSTGSHQNIVKLFDHFSIGSQQIMVLEMLETDLRGILEKSILPVDKIRKYARDILKGLDHLHKKSGIIHMDLKPENLMISVEGDCKIVDFGISATKTGPLNRITQTCNYRPPELFLSSSKVSTAADIWSFGCTLYEIVTRFLLFPCYHCSRIKHMDQISAVTGPVFQSYFEKTPGNSGIFEMVFEGKPILKNRPEPWLNPMEMMNEHPMGYEDAGMLSDLLKQVLRSNPEERLTAKEALEHPFLMEEMNGDY